MRCKHELDLGTCALCSPSGERTRRNLRDIESATQYILGMGGFDGPPSSGWPDHERPRDAEDAYPRQTVDGRHRCTVACYVVSDRPTITQVPPVAPAEYVQHSLPLVGDVTKLRSFGRPKWAIEFWHATHYQDVDLLEGRPVVIAANAYWDDEEVIDTSESVVK